MEYQQISDLYNQMNNYILRHFEFFWVIILGAFAVIGIALFFIVKRIVYARVEKGLKDATEQIQEHEKSILIEVRKVSQLEIGLSSLENLEKINTENAIRRLDNLEKSFEHLKLNLENLEISPQEFNLPLSIGFSPLPDHKCCYSKSGNNLVLVMVAVKIETENMPYGNHHFGSLPCGFIPSSRIEFLSTNGVRIIIDSNGCLSLFGINPPSETIIGSVVFYAQ